MSGMAVPNSNIPPWLKRMDDAGSEAAWDTAPDACCGRSRGCKKRGRLRDNAFKIVLSPWFRLVSTLITISNAVILFMYDPLAPASAPRNAVGLNSAVAFGVLFTLDALLNACAFGIVGPGSYLMSVWRCIDLLSVVLTWLSLTPVTGNLSAVRLLRLMRLLTLSDRTSVIVSAVFAAGPALATVGVLVALCVGAFALLGLQLWSGMMAGACGYADPGSGQWVWTEYPCIVPCSGVLPGSGCKWAEVGNCPQMPAVFAQPPSAVPNNATIVSTVCARYLNPGNDQATFDNFGSAMITSLWAYTTEGWSGIANSIGTTWGYEGLVMALWSVHTFVGAFALLELVLAIVFDSYEDAIGLQALLRQREERQRTLMRGVAAERLPLCSRTVWLYRPQLFFSALLDALLALLQRIPACCIACLCGCCSCCRRKGGCCRPQGGDTTAAPPGNTAIAAPLTLSVLGGTPSKSIGDASGAVAAAAKGGVTGSDNSGVPAATASPSSPAAGSPAAHGSSSVAAEVRADSNVWLSAGWPWLRSRLVHTSVFEGSSLLLVLLSAVLLALDSERLSSQQRVWLHVGLDAVSVMMVGEVALRVAAWGPLAYFRDPLERWDFAIAVAIAVDVIWDIIDIANGSVASGAPRAFMMVRAFRITRLLLAWDGGRTILFDLLAAVPAVSGVLCVFALFVLVAAAIGMQLIGGTYDDAIAAGVLDELPRINFNSLGSVSADVVSLAAAIQRLGLLTSACSICWLLSPLHNHRRSVRALFAYSCRACWPLS